MDEKRRQRERQAEAGRWLRTERERAGFATLNQFARALGIDQSQVSRYELGTSAVSDDRAEKIAEVLRIDIITVRRNLGLWAPDEAEPAPQSTQRRGITDEEIRNSGLRPETVEALLRMRRRVERWTAERDEESIRRADRIQGALEDEDTA